MQNWDFLHMKQVCERMCKFTSCLKYANPSNPNVCRSGMIEVSKREMSQRTNLLNNHLCLIIDDKLTWGA